MCFAASKPRPVLAPVMMTVLPVRSASLGIETAPRRPMMVPYTKVRKSLADAMFLDGLRRTCSKTKQKSKILDLLEVIADMLWIPT